ncbi:DUF4097 family beta strand repeat-containing protein [Streptomyces lancefieldiae]|uniref:DUF4097 family beta strand repeat-containing protein n=1 Tax=Streptomyces lancefieldiae TaxID=3075520 RepID=A0ABU3AIA1_9ACTN|nr:DUF4097 family beta strand repeat-containing protein [Streptomyces sp. DSM 40712]MDT0609904.1 DUF4097 family beta strand repeat-containing protein [Streptomyces sp. DSM 40712]
MYSKRVRNRSGRHVLVAASVVLAGAALTACSEKTTVDESRYRVDGKVTSLHITSNGGDVEVVAANSSVIDVTERIEYADEKPRTEHSVRNGELSLDAPGCGKGDAGECSVDYTLAVPHGTVLSVDTGGGDITVRDLAGAVDAKTGGGNIRIDGSTAKKVAAHTGGGNIDASFTAVPDQVETESEGGDVTVRLPAGPYAVDARTEGGDRRVDVAGDPSSAHKVKAHTGGGNLTVVTTG